MNKRNKKNIKNQIKFKSINKSNKVIKRIKIDK